MPIYEYICLDCRERFETLRPMKDADAAITCENCQGKQVSRVISVFFASSGGRVVAGGATACSSCSSGACASCRVN